MKESTFTEEFVNCTGSNQAGPGCTRSHVDHPGATGGLIEGVFFEAHMVLRYQIWDRCRGQSLGTADHTLDISGSNNPRTIDFV